MNYEGDLESALGFFKGKSEFYTDFDRLCRQRVVEQFPSNSDDDDDDHE